MDIGAIEFVGTDCKSRPIECPKCSSTRDDSDGRIDDVTDVLLLVNEPEVDDTDSIADEGDRKNRCYSNQSSVN